MARIPGISGSPHPDGKTAFAVRHALGLCAETGHETRHVRLAGLRTIANLMRNLGLKLG